MAFKSPGIYQTEYDNTEYSNPVAEVGTTVAIIGFAKKGPVSEPTEITSYKNFKSTFGTPIAGQYAGLAVRSVLNAGGTVLFTRICDTSVATKSNVILKTSTPRSDGMLVVNNKSNITVGTDGYENGEVYTGKLSDYLGTNTKTMILRSPSSGKFQVSEMLKQLNSCLSESYGIAEYALNSSISSSYRNFSLQIGGNTINADTGKTVAADTTTFGPYYVQVLEDDKDSLVESINAALEKGTTPYQRFDLGTENEYISFDSAGNIKLADNQKTTKYFRLALSGSDTVTLSINLASISSTSVSIDDFVTLLNNVLNSSGILVESCLDKSTNKHYLLFVSKNNVDFEILPAISTDGDKTTIDEDNSLFVPLISSSSSSSDTPSGGLYAIKSGDNYVYYYDSTTTVDTTKTFLLGWNKSVGTKYTTENDLPATAEYNEETDTLIFTVNNNSNTNIQAVGSTIEVVSSDVGKYFLFDDGSSAPTSDDDEAATFRYTDNKSNVGSKKFLCKGEAASNVSVLRNSNGQIYFYQDGILIAPTLKDLSDSEAYNTKGISNLFGDTMTEEAFENAGLTEGSYKCLISKAGSTEVAASENDMIIFTAREYGEGTTNIGVEIYTSYSAIENDDGTYDETHYIDLYVDGVKKEGWEDVSYNKKDDNYFLTLINQDSDNGGSAYITAAVRQKSTGQTINVPDTAEYTSDGIIYLGTAIDDDSVEKTDDISSTAYDYYDYSVGTNGIPSDTNDLFTAELDPEESALSNKDLYSWHILITPDNILQEVQDEAINLCENMGDAIYIADPPQGLSRDGVIKWHNGKASYRDTAFDSNFACVYYPWLKVYDSTTSEYTWCMPSVLMAANFCKVDKNYNPWYAPAGVTNGLLSTAINVEKSLNKTDRDNLYLDGNRINPIIKLKNGNIIVYGEKTTQRKNSTLTKIHTRRMLISLKKKLNAQLKNYIFQPSTSSNISEISEKATSILEKFKTGGGISSYTVDTSKNTTETLQQDILYIDISVVPVGCIEQVEISLNINKSE